MLFQALIPSQRLETPHSIFKKGRSLQCLKFIFHTINIEQGILDSLYLGITLVSKCCIQWTTHLFNIYQVNKRQRNNSKNLTVFSVTVYHCSSQSQENPRVGFARQVNLKGIYHKLHFSQHYLKMTLMELLLDCKGNLFL